MTKSKVNFLKVLFLSIMFTACSSDDDNEPTEVEGSGGDHTYEIELIGETETIQVSGTVPNPPEGDLFSATSVYVNENPDEEGLLLTLALTDNDNLEGIYGMFGLNDNRQSMFPISHPEDNDGSPARLRIRPAGSNFMYHAISGTLTFSNVKLAKASSGSGLASYTLNFEGDFEDPLDEDNIYQGSGTIVFNPLEGISYN